MRMKPGPSSARLFSKCAQSTMSRASSLTPSSLFAAVLRPRLHGAWHRSERVKFALAPLLAAAGVERIRPAAEVEAQRNRAKIEVAPQRVHEIAPVAFGKLVGAVAEDDEARRPRLHLSDVAQLDPLPLGRGRRVRLDRILEPAVELARRHALAPGLAQLERDLEHRIDALAGLGRDGEQRHVAQLGEA